MTDAAHSSEPVLVLDFDGTVCVGDAPVWAYADAIIADLLDTASTSQVDLDATIRARLGAFLDGEPGSPAYIDGYHAVAALAADHSTAEQLQRAYATSRRALADGSIDVSTPPGLGNFLRGLDGVVERVLVTNAPADGINETLESLGLGDAIDRVLTHAGKPAGWSALLPDLIATRAPEAVMAVGDIWGNDVEAPLAAGCSTALIDRFGHRAGPAHLVARSFEELFPGIRQWANDPRAFAAEHAPEYAPAQRATT